MSNLVSIAKTPSQRLPRNERISKIVAVTRAMLNEMGYENILTLEVAQRCGVSEATIYKYFDSKRDLLIRVAEQWFEELLAEDQRNLKQSSARDALRHVVWRSLMLVRREPALTRFVLLDLRPDPSYRSMAVFELNRHFTSRVTDVIKQGMKSGELGTAVPLPLLRDMIFGCIEHQTWAFLRGEGDFSVDDATEGIVRVIYNGVALKANQTSTPDALPTIDRLEKLADRLEKLAPAQTEKKPQRNRLTRES
jgi:AcrR family transcriptional regulator